MLIHGSYSRRKQRGLAADECARCEAIRPFLLVDHYEVQHVYFIPLGGGTYRGSTRQCQACRQMLPGRAALYDTVLTKAEAGGLTDEQFVVATNPGLVLPEPERSRWMAAVADVTLFGGSSRETLPELAVTRLRKAGLSAEQFARFADRYAEWSVTSLMTRLELLTETAAVLGGEGQRVAYYFATVAMRSPPAGAGCLLAIPLGLLLTACWAGLMVLTYHISGPELGTVLVLAMMFAALVSGAVLFEWCARRAYRTWFLKRVVEPAEAGGIDLAAVVRVFRETKADGSTPENVKALLRKAKVLERLVREREMAPSQVG